VCAAGTASPTAGATDRSSCVPCAPGSYAYNASSTCSLCPTGTYHPLPSAPSLSSCEPCPADTVSPSGSTSSSACLDATTMFRCMTIVEFTADILLRGATNFVPINTGAPLNNAESIVVVGDSFLVSSSFSNAIFEYRHDGTFVGVFASLNTPRGLLYLPQLDPPQVAVANELNMIVLFFVAADGLNNGDLQGYADAVNSITLPQEKIGAEFDDWAYEWLNVYGQIAPQHLALVNDDYILVGSGANDYRHVHLACVNATVCQDSVRHVLLHEWGGALSMAKLPNSVSLGRFLVVHGAFVLSCPISEALQPTAESQGCTDFAENPPVDDWMPFEVHVDAPKQLVFVSDATNFKVHAFDLDGKYLSSVSTPSIALSIAFRPGFCVDASFLSPPAILSASAPINFELAARDRFGRATAAPSGLTLTAHGEFVLPSSSQPVPLSFDGTIGLNSATVNVVYTGDWVFELAEVFASSEFQVGRAKRGELCVCGKTGWTRTTRMCAARLAGRAPHMRLLCVTRLARSAVLRKF